MTDRLFPELEGSNLGIIGEPLVKVPIFNPHDQVSDREDCYLHCESDPISFLEVPEVIKEDQRKTVKEVENTEVKPTKAPALESSSSFPLFKSMSFLPGILNKEGQFDNKKTMFVDRKCLMNKLKKGTRSNNNSPTKFGNIYRAIKQTPTTKQNLELTCSKYHSVIPHKIKKVHNFKFPNLHLRSNTNIRENLKYKFKQNKSPHNLNLKPNNVKIRKTIYTLKDKINNTKQKFGYITELKYSNEPSKINSLIYQQHSHNTRKTEIKDKNKKGGSSLKSILGIRNLIIQNINKKNERLEKEQIIEPKTERNKWRSEFFDNLLRKTTKEYFVSTNEQYSLIHSNKKKFK